MSESGGGVKGRGVGYEAEEEDQDHHHNFAGQEENIYAIPHGTGTSSVSDQPFQDMIQLLKRMRFGNCAELFGEDQGMLLERMKRRNEDKMDVVVGRAVFAIEQGVHLFRKIYASLMLDAPEKESENGSGVEEERGEEGKEEEREGGEKWGGEGRSPSFGSSRGRGSMLPYHLKEGDPRRKMIKPLKLGIIGCGRVGQAIVKRCLAYKIFSPEEIIISTRRPQTLKIFLKHHITVVFDNERVVREAGIVCVCCLDHQVQLLGKDIHSGIRDDQLLISVIPTCSVKKIQANLGGACTVLVHANHYNETNRKSGLAVVRTTGNEDKEDRGGGEEDEERTRSIRLNSLREPLHSLETIEKIDPLKDNNRFDYCIDLFLSLLNMSLHHGIEWLASIGLVNQILFGTDFDKPLVYFETQHAFGLVEQHSASSLVKHYLNRLPISQNHVVDIMENSADSPSLNGLGDEEVDEVDGRGSGDGNEIKETGENAGRSKQGGEGGSENEVEDNELEKIEEQLRNVSSRRKKFTKGASAIELINACSEVKIKIPKDKNSTLVTDETAREMLIDFFTHHQVQAKFKGVFRETLQYEDGTHQTPTFSLKSADSSKAALLYGDSPLRSDD
eukprot:Nk52_evm21s217 gene=Nk52_evmTU21s217